MIRDQRRQILERRHKTLNQLMRLRANQEIVDRVPLEDLPALIADHLNYRISQKHDVVSVESHRRGLSSSFRGEINALLQAHSRNIVGAVRNKAQLRNVLRELHGGKTGDAPAKEIADAFRATAERARQLFNAHGGNIGKLHDWGLPHTHDPRRLKNRADEWKAFIAERLDWSRIINRDTEQPFAAPGQRPAPQDEARFLDDIYNGLSTDGWDDRLPSMTSGGRALFSRRAEHRILHFRDADAWLEYNEEFGRTNPFDAMINHLEGMARDIALMRVLGPNPQGGLEHLIQAATRRAKLSGNADVVKRVEIAAKSAQPIMDIITGAANVPVRETFARIMAGTRNVLASAQLGSALLSSVTDIWTARLTAKSIGLNPGNVLSTVVRLAASPEHRDMAASLGFVAQTMADTAAGTARFYNDVFSGEITQRLSGAVMRAQGLSFWTDMNRIGFQMSMAADLANHAHLGRGLDQMGELGALLRRRGVTDEDWRLLSDPELLSTPRPDARFLTPQEWRRAAIAGGMETARAENLSARLQAIMEEQLERAVPTRNIRLTAALGGALRPGTVMGELARSGLSYKSFPIAIMMNQYEHVMSLPTPMAKARYMASFVAGTTLLGALAIQLKEIAKGNDPRPMDDYKFIGGALLQGGGLGIFGDFLVAETARTGGGLAEVIVGPVGGLVGDGLRMGQSNVARMLEGREPLLGRDVTNFARFNTPGTNLWFSRVAMDRLVWDQMQLVLDPEAEVQWRRQARRRLREYRNTPWWRRGELLPDRAPDLSNAVGGQP
ncbi:MAG: hypothetical protein AAF909_15260 [Pseudomonadota bacterium]